VGGEDALSISQVCWHVTATRVASSVISSSNSACASHQIAVMTTAMATGALEDLIASSLGDANILNR